MTLHRYAPQSSDTPPQLQGLYGLAMPMPPQGSAGSYYGGMGNLELWPALIIGAGIGAATIAEWLSNDDWDVGTYNQMMREMNNTIGGGVPGEPGGWDALGWVPYKGAPRGCWGKYPQQRKAWLIFWREFATHFREHGIIRGVGGFSYVSDDEERPARRLMKKLQGWGEWFDKRCGRDIAAAAGAYTRGDSLDPSTPGGAPTGPITAWAPLVKWGAIGLGAVLLLTVVNAARGLKD